MKCLKYLNSYIILLLPVIFANNLRKIEEGAGKLETLTLGIDDLYRPLDELSTYTTIYPKIAQTQKQQRISRSIENNEQTENEHSMTLSFELNGKVIYADLMLKNDFLSKSHRLHLQDPSDSTRYLAQNFTKTDMKLCHYQGAIRQKPESKVVISTCSENVNGVIFMDGVAYYIHAANTKSIQDKHLLIKHQDLIKPNEKIQQNSFKDELLQKIEARRQFKTKQKRASGYPRQPFIEPNDANDESAYLEFAIFIDNAMFEHYERNIQKIHTYCMDLTNLLSAYYEPLNIYIVLIDIIIWNRVNPIEISKNSDITLKRFMAHRKSMLAEFPNDNVQLLTRQRFPGIRGLYFEENIIGRAHVGSICTTEQSGAVCMDSSPVIGVVAATMAHEMGHNFGLSHDEETSGCENLPINFIMSARSALRPPTGWSPCSLKKLKNALRLKMTYCMLNKPRSVFGTPICGNGIIERGEQCDCGSTKNCNHECCNPKTCQLYDGYQCASGKCCELETCQFKNGGTQCRGAQNECDLPEFCTGENRTCPANTFKQDLQPCDNGAAYCLRGQCKSHRLGCQFIWGPGADSKYSTCYNNNKRGTLNGHCGYDRLRNVSKPCEDADKLCGLLQCQPVAGREKFAIGLESMNRQYWRSFEYADSKSNNFVECYQSALDFGVSNDDVNMVGNGAKCGEQRMCYNQKCLRMEQLRAEGGLGKSCPNNCSGNGICNSLGNCHCDIGFGGKTCSQPGFGGSIDSGPATNPNPASILKRFLLLFGGLILLAIICILLIVIYTHCRCLTLRNKKPSQTLSQIDVDGYTNPMLPQSIVITVNNVPLKPPALNADESEYLTSTSHANLLEQASPTSLQPPTTKYSLSVLDLTQKNLPNTTMKTLPKTLNLSQQSMRKLNNKPTKITRSHNNLNEELAKQIKSLRSVNTTPKGRNPVKTKSCENLSGN